MYILSGQGFLQFGVHLYFWLCATNQHSPEEELLDLKLAVYGLGV